MISCGPYMIFPDAWYYGDPPDGPDESEESPDQVSPPGLPAAFRGAGNG